VKWAGWASETNVDVVEAEGAEAEAEAEAEDEAEEDEAAEEGMEVHSSLVSSTSTR